MATIWIPSLLRSLTNNQAQVEAEGQTVRQIVADLERQYPGIQARLCQDDRLRPGLAVVVDGQTALLGLAQPVKSESEVHFVPAIAGGT